MPTSPKVSVSPSSVMADYFDYVEQYRSASSLLNEGGHIFWPRIQTRGLLVELALKAYLCSTGALVEGHDLVALAKDAVKNGLVLSTEDWEHRIERINEIYFKHIAWNAKYLSRYPTPDRGLGAWITPGHAILDEMIDRIVQQARVQWKAHEGAA